MRKTPQKPPSETTQARLREAERQSKHDRTKLLMMCAGLILIVGAYFMSGQQSAKQRSQQDKVVGEDQPFVEHQVVPPFDIASIADKIHDTRPEDRVLLPSELTLPLTQYVAGKNDGHFYALGLTPLDAPTRTKLTETPAEFRGQAYRARGKMEEIKSRKRLDGKTEFRGWLRAPDGTATHFICMSVPGEITLTGSVRMDGLFLKLFRAEGHDGEWVSGPLLVGAQLVNSYAPLTAEDISPESLKASLDKVTDDTARVSTGLDGKVFDAQWRLMDFVRSDAYKAIDWEHDAVELTNDVMADMLNQGSAWRYRLAGDDDPEQNNVHNRELPPLTADLIPVPIRLPISRNMGINTRNPGENPANFDTITEGWIGNMTWTNQAGVLYFRLGENRPDLEDRVTARLVEGRGFFVKNHNYMSKDRGTHTAPFFVMTEMKIFTPTENTMAKDLMFGIMIATLLLAVAFPLLLMRDRKKSEKLRKDLVRRKQERRRLAATDQ